MDEYKIRRSKLYYIRNKVGKAAKFTSILDSNRRGDSLGFNELKLANQPKIEETKEEKKVVETPKVEVKEETTEEKSE